MLCFVVYRMSAVRNPIKEPTDITGGYNVEMEVTFHFFIWQYDCQTWSTWIPQRLESRSLILSLSSSQLIQQKLSVRTPKPDITETKQAKTHLGSLISMY